MHCCRVTVLTSIEENANFLIFHLFFSIYLGLVEYKRTQIVL